MGLAVTLRDHQSILLPLGRTSSISVISGRCFSNQPFKRFSCPSRWPIFTWCSFHNRVFPKPFWLKLNSVPFPPCSWWTWKIDYPSHLKRSPPLLPGQEASLLRLTVEEAEIKADGLDRHLHWRKKDAPSLVHPNYGCEPTYGRVYLPLLFMIPAN